MIPAPAEIPKAPFERHASKGAFGVIRRDFKRGLCSAIRIQPAWHVCAGKEKGGLLTDLKRRIYKDSGNLSSEFLKGS